MSADIHPADLPEDLAAEMLAVTREAARIARVGGTGAERMALARRRDAVLRHIEFDEAKRELQSRRGCAGGVLSRAHALHVVAPVRAR